MFDYLQQFKRLPQELQDFVSSPEAMKSLDEIEARHGVKLASAVMRLMVKDLTLEKLPLFFASEFSLNEEESKKIVEELKNGVLKKASSHLGFQAPVADNFEERIANALKNKATSFPSQALVERFKTIARTYLHSVRSKIDTRLIMQKSVEAGGLGWSMEQADRIFTLLDGKDPALDLPKRSAVIERLIAKDIIQPEYNLAKAIEDRKKKLLAEKELLAKDPQKDLPQIEPQKDLPLPAKTISNTVATPHNLPFAEPVSETPVTKPVASVGLKKEEDVASPDELEAFLNKISQGPGEKKSPEIDKKDDVIKPIIPAPVAPSSNTTSITPSPTPEIKTAIPAEVVSNKEILPPPFIPKEKPVAGLINIPVKSEAKDVPEQPVITTPAIKEDAKINFEVVPTAKLVVPPRPVNSFGLKIAPVTQASEQGRVKMDDVRISPRVMGPIEELRFMDLITFRRLGANPTEATNKILAKIKLLEHDGYDRMTAGIAAWRQSETNHLYLNMCRDSAFQAKSLSEIIETCKQQQQDCLSQEEIDAIMSLNAKLLF